MITYEPFWNELKNSRETQYTLITYHRISPGHIYRLRNNLPLCTTTINQLCNVLQCNVSHILSFRSDSADKTTSV